jgi:hypothetical protein
MLLEGTNHKNERSKYERCEDKFVVTIKSSVCSEHPNKQGQKVNIWIP